MRLLSTDYYATLAHWHKKLNGSPHKLRFLATKMIEITSTVLNRGNISGKKLEDDVVPEFLNIDNEIGSDSAKLAVVVPVYVKSKAHEEKLLSLIRSLENQTYKDLTIIFIDDCSPLGYHVPSNFHHVRLPENLGPAGARNRGIEEALDLDADIIAFTDSDCIAHEEWAMSIVSAFTENKYIHALSGNTISYDKCWFGEYQNINGTLNGRRFRYSDFLLYGATCNFAVTKRVTKEGGIRFNTTFPSAAAEDLEFSFRIIEKGFNIAFVKEMIIYHNYGYTGNFRHDFSIFWKQFARYGEGEKRLLEVIPYYYEYLDRSDEIESVLINNR